jgi:ABC-type transporter MlaC component
MSKIASDTNALKQLVQDVIQKAEEKEFALPPEILTYMEKNKSGEWKVIDVSISGLSWVESIRDQVTDVVKKKKWIGLKEAMNKRLAEVKAGNI